jgi:2'-5' RNA ligase
VALLGLRWTDIRASRRQDASYKRIWQAFRSAKHVQDGRHDTAEWRAHSPAVYAFVAVRIPVAAIEPALDEIRRGLGPLPFVRQHPDHFLHITLQELGFVKEAPSAPDEIDQARLDEFVSQLPSALSGAPVFDLRLGGANAFQDAVFLDVHDRGHCGRLHSRLRELAGVLSVPRLAYLPHATIAHFTNEEPIDDLPQLIGRWRDRRFGTFEVSAIEVVTIDVRLTYPRLATYAVHELDRP